MENLIHNHLGFGCVALASQKTLKDALNLLELAYASGIVYYDTAPLYSKGYSECILGKFQKNKREQLIITTKFGLGQMKPLLPTDLALRLKYLLKGKLPSKNIEAFKQVDPSPLSFRKIDREDIENGFHQSLKNLKTDYVDNFLLHEGSLKFLTEDALIFLQQIKQQGKVKKIGLATNFHNILDEKDVNIWDILQYENGPHYPYSDNFVNERPGKVHIYHSILKGISQMKTAKLSRNELASIILLAEIRKNPSGRVLFSTSNAQHLVGNLKYLSTCNSYNDTELKHLIDYALS